MNHLFDRIKDKIESVKMIDILHEDLVMRSFLEKTGFEIYVRQYEMEYHLTI